MSQNFNTLVSAFGQVWRDPERTNSLALCDEKQQLSYGDLHKAVGKLSGQLRAAGVGEGDRVALAMERSARLALSILAVMVCGGCPLPLEPQLGPEETARRFHVARIDWTLLDSAHQDDESFGLFPSQRRILIDSLPEASSYWSSDLPLRADGFLLFTSGSSGKPKGVLQNHEGMLTNARGVIGHTGLSAADRLLLVMPLYHTNGVNNQLLAPLLAGSTVIVADRFRADEMPALMARHHPTIFTGVPTMYSRMLEYEFSAESLAQLRMLRCGSAPIMEELHRQIEAKFGIPLIVSYGLSEATCTSTINPPGHRKIGSVGTPLQGQTVFLQTPNGERITTSGGDGEICITGPILMTGYLDESTRGEALPVGEVLHSGDVGRFDEDGYLFITGRIKDIIIRGGENLSPNLIEEALTAVPGVASCCVVGRPHPDLGEVPVAFIVCHSPAEGRIVNPDLLGAAVLQKLSRAHQPVEYFFVDTLPENSVGKVDRKKLSARAKQ